MITTTLVAMLLAASPADNAYGARKAYIACLDAEVDGNLEKKTAPDAFPAAAAAACQSKLDAWKTAYIASDAADGIKPKDSADSFELDAQDFVESYKDRYKDFFDSGSRPVKK